MKTQFLRAFRVGVQIWDQFLETIALLSRMSHIYGTCDGIRTSAQLHSYGILDSGPNMHSTYIRNAILNEILFIYDTRLVLMKSTILWALTRVLSWEFNEHLFSSKANSNKLKANTKYISNVKSFHYFHYYHRINVCFSMAIIESRAFDTAAGAVLCHTVYNCSIQSVTAQHRVYHSNDTFTGNIS